MPVKIIFICHDEYSVIKVLNSNKPDLSIIFVGDQSLPEYLMADSRVIIARNYADNIESNKELLTFTAWYVISKNNLFMEYDYLCLLEYDVTLDKNLLDNLSRTCSTNTYDVIAFQGDNSHFYSDVSVNVLNYALHKMNINPEHFNRESYWYGSTNKCINRNILNEFVNIAYPILKIISILDHKHVSWYHERLFSAYAIFHNKRNTIVNGVFHAFNDSHKVINRDYKIPGNLTNLFISNPNCEYLNKFIFNYNMFNRIHQVCNHNTIAIESYLCDTDVYVYSDNLYEKQRLLFHTAKKNKHILTMGVGMGHSLLVMLLANPEINITCILNDNEIYGEIIIDLFNKEFNANIVCIKSNRTNELFGVHFDLYHINLPEHNTTVIDAIKSTLPYINTSSNKICYILNHYNSNENEINNYMGNNIHYFKIFDHQISNSLDKCIVYNLINCDSELKKLAYECETDKLPHGYISVYETYLNKFKHEVFNLLEIGVFFGSSIKMWGKYFPNAIIYGADHFTGKQGNGSIFDSANLFLNEVNNTLNKYDNTELIILDQSNENQLINFKKKKIRDKLKFRIVLDDGSHLMRDQQLSFFYLFDLLEEGGIYIIEDIHTSEQNDYDVLPDKSNSTKKLFEYMQNGNIFDSIYVNDAEKCKEITSQILDIKFFTITNDSQTMFIFKK